MSKESSGRWSLAILAAYSQRWSQRVAQEFRAGVSSLLADVEDQMRTEHSSLHLESVYPAAGHRGTELGVSFAFAILDVTDYDEDLAFLAGLLRGARVPYVLVCQGDWKMMTLRWGLNDARVIPYQSTGDLFQTNSALSREISRAISQPRILEEFVYELWFPRDTSSIWVVCPQIHDPGEFANRSSPDYTYLDNLGDTDALLEVMVFLSRYYPKASIEKFSSDDLPREHTKDNLVVIGGPGSSDEISNHVCLELMTSLNSRVSYSADCDSMIVTLDGAEFLELRADLRSDGLDSARPDGFKMRRDYGFFARFPNPLNTGAAVMLVNGIHTAGVLGAARAFADRRESLMNYHLLFISGVSPKSFECHFEVKVINGEVIVPSIQSDSVYFLGPPKMALPDALSIMEEGRLDAEDLSQVTVLFVAGDRGGLQHNQIQIPRELGSIKSALRACMHKGTFQLATPILGATHANLVEAYRERPAILHFAGHGDDRSLSFILDQGLLASSTPLLATQLAAILRSFPGRVRLCVLNTCESKLAAEHLVRENVVDAAIGWPGKLADEAAAAFSAAFYGALGDGLSLLQSVTLASQCCGPADSPVLCVAEGVDQNTNLFVPGG